MKKVLVLSVEMLICQQAQATAKLYPRMTKTISSSDPRTIATRALDKISVSRDERSALADLVLLTPTILLAIRSVL